MYLGFPPPRDAGYNYTMSAHGPEQPAERWTVWHIDDNANTFVVREHQTMKWIGTKNMGMLLLGVWLVVTGASAFVRIPFPNMAQILSAVALAAGILILAGR